MRHSEDFACQRLHSTAMTYKIVLIGLFIVISTIQRRIVELQSPQSSHLQNIEDGLASASLAFGLHMSSDILI